MSKRVKRKKKKLPYQPYFGVRQEWQIDPTEKVIQNKRGYKRKFRNKKEEETEING